MSKQEALVRVNSDDQVIGTIDRATAHRKREYIHREIGVIILRTNNKILFQQRALSKEILPGWWSTGCAGHVQESMSPRQTAREELKEELGLKVDPDLDLEFLGKEYIEHQDEMRDEAHFKYWYVLRVGAEFEVQLNPEEVAVVRFLDIDQVNDMKQRKAQFYQPYLRVVDMVLSGDNSQLIMEEYE